MKYKDANKKTPDSKFYIKAIADTSDLEELYQIQLECIEHQSELFQDLANPNSCIDGVFIQSALKETEFILGMVKDRLLVCKDAQSRLNHNFRMEAKRALAPWLYDSIIAVAKLPRKKSNQ